MKELSIINCPLIFFLIPPWPHDGIVTQRGQRGIVLFVSII